MYRRGNFNGTWDPLVVDAIMDEKGAEIAFSPGFRWGTSLLPGQAITRDVMMDPLAITYPRTTLTEMSGETLKTILEDVCDNLFNPDPYYQQGGDMVRVGGLEHTCTPGGKAGSRNSDMRLKGKAIEADKTYKVGGWAPVAEATPSARADEPIWDGVEQYLRDQKVVKPRRLNSPKRVVRGQQPGARRVGEPVARASEPAG